MSRDKGTDFFPFLVETISVSRFGRDFKFLSETHSKSHLVKDDVTKQMRIKVIQIGENIVSVAKWLFCYESISGIKCQKNPS